MKAKPKKPAIGESRLDAGELIAPATTRAIELLAGTEGERLLCPGEPLDALDGRRQARRFAELACCIQSAADSFSIIAERGYSWHFARSGSVGDWVDATLHTEHRSAQTSYLAKPFRDWQKRRAYRCGSACHGVALLRGFVTPSLAAQGGQRLPSYFNIQRGISQKSSLTHLPHSVRQALMVDKGSMARY